MPEFVTACPRNCYSTCSLRVSAEAGRVARVTGMPENLATPEGPCLKGLAYVERAQSSQRLTRPLRRMRDGAFQPISWAEALDLVAQALTRARDVHGPRSVFYYCGSGTKGLLNGVGLAFWRPFGGCTKTRLTLGDNSHNAPWDLERARLIVIWGKNPAKTNVHQMLHVHRALEKGAGLVVIDPRRSETAERADLLVQLRPGTDGAQALGLGHVLLRDGLVDREFVEGTCSGSTTTRRSCRPGRRGRPCPTAWSVAWVERGSSGTWATASGDGFSNQRRPARKATRSRRASAFRAWGASQIFSCFGSLTLAAHRLGRAASGLGRAAARSLPAC